MTPVVNFATGTAVVVDTGGKLTPVSTTHAANNGNNIRLSYTLKWTMSANYSIEKIQNVPNGILGGLGVTNSWKKPQIENLVALSL
jgi:hypothetical protein